MLNNFLIVLLIGITLRLIISFSTFHPDIQAFNFGGWLVSSGYLLTLYDFSLSLPDTSPLSNIAVLNYPPAVYYFHGFFSFLYKILGLSLANNFLVVNSNTFGDLLFNIHLLVIKIPYIVVDILAAFCLTKLFNAAKEKFLVFSMWLFNPINLHATYMMGQFDIIPTFFVILSLLLIKQKRVLASSISLGVGTAFKIYPIFLLIPLVLSQNNFKDKLKLAALGILPYFVSILPYLNSAGFRSTALIADQTLKSFYSKIDISGGASIFLFPLAMIIFYLYIYFKRVEISFIWRYFFVTLLIFFIFTHFHPQWLLWLSPFLVIELIVSKFKRSLLTALIICSFLFSLFFFDPSLTIKIFAPIWPQLDTFFSLWEILGLSIDLYFFRSILHTVLVASALYFMIIYFPKARDEKNN